MAPFDRPSRILQKGLNQDLIFVRMAANSPRREEGSMESYPFHHHNLFFNIMTDYDLTFKEIRGILDYLVGAEAFKEEGENWGEGKFYDIQLGKILYEVDVNRYDVIIYRRRELG